jgi:hypothetical protein
LAISAFPTAGWIVKLTSTETPIAKSAIEVVPIEK